MGSITGTRSRLLAWPCGMLLSAAALLAAPPLLGDAPHAAELKAMTMGLGEGVITSDPPGIDCGERCVATYGEAQDVTLRAVPKKGSAFSKWFGDCHRVPEGDGTCTVKMNEQRSVRAVFDLVKPIASLETVAVKGQFPPEAIQKFLDGNSEVDTPAKFVSALPPEYRQNWILMTRSESLQTGTAEFPRLLLPSADAKHVFTIGLGTHGSYPSSHPNAIEFMQWDGKEKNFRFHEIVLNKIDPMGKVPVRLRGVARDDPKCSLCHSTQNVFNPGPTAGTMAPGSRLKARGRPNWDAYDSWGGMLPFNRDRIYQGSVEAAAFRKIFNPWTWRDNKTVRDIVEQLDLQPPDMVPRDVIARHDQGGANDGDILFAFDLAPAGDLPSVPANYRFDGAASTGQPTDVQRDQKFIVLRHSLDPADEKYLNTQGRGVNLFDRLGGLAGERLNQQRIAGELIDHRHGVGNKDVRAVALAIAGGCLSIDGDRVVSTSTTPLGGDQSRDREAFYKFFDDRNGMKIKDLVADTDARTKNLVRRKADIQKLNLDREGDFYLIAGKPAPGLMAQYDGSANAGANLLPRIHQEVFRRPVKEEGFEPDDTVMGRIYVDREFYNPNTEKVTLYRYFLEPLGVAVDRWSMGVRGRSRNYAFADVFGTYEAVLREKLAGDLGLPEDFGREPLDPQKCEVVIAAANRALSPLPEQPRPFPEFVEVQRIFNKACVECHGGLGYPPYSRGSLDLSENETPSKGDTRLTRSEDNADNAKPNIDYRLNIAGDEDQSCKGFRAAMPCGGRRLSKVDHLTLQAWLNGRTARVAGNSHITTVSGADYDFQGAGEFVLLRGVGLEIQGRQVGLETDAPLGANAHNGLSSCASVINGVAVKVGGHRVTYQSRIGVPGPDGLELRIDGNLTRFDGKQIVLASGPRIVRTGAPGGIQVELPGQTAVAIIPGWLDSQKLWHFSIHVRQARASEGVMGSIPPGSWLPALPDGTLVGARPENAEDRYNTLYGTFANAWRVSEKTSLFDYEPGTSAKTFALEAWPGQARASCRLPQEVKIARVAPATTMARGTATEHCGSIATESARSSCVEDVMAVGEPAFAKTYALGELAHRKGLGAEPVLLGPEDSTTMAAPVTFTWKRAPHLRGQPVSYLHCVWDVNERFGFNVCSAVAGGDGTGAVSTTAARLEPGREYFWKVFAEDGQGDSIESVTWRLTVK